MVQQLEAPSIDNTIVPRESPELFTIRHSMGVHWIRTADGAKPITMSGKCK